MKYIKNTEGPAVVQSTIVVCSDWTPSNRGRSECGYDLMSTDNSLIDCPYRCVVEVPVR